MSWSAHQAETTGKGIKMQEERGKSGTKGENSEKTAWEPTQGISESKAPDYLKLHRNNRLWEKSTKLPRFFSR